MSVITVHRFCKTLKPISVDGKEWGSARLVGKVWEIFPLFASAPVASASSVRGIEFALAAYLRGAA